MGKLIWFLNYVVSNSDATVAYIVSDMCLYVHSDASYLSDSKARSRADAHILLSSHTNRKLTLDLRSLNGPAHVVLKTIKFVMASATEAEIGASFIVAQESLSMMSCLKELDHEQSQY